MPVCTYRAEDHAYFLDGERIFGITDILTLNGLRPPYGELADDASRQRGTEVHRYCALYELDAVTIPEVPEVFRGYVESWRKGKADQKLVTSDVEMIVYSVTRRYAGRLDWKGTHHGDIRTIVDWKSGAIGPDAKWQTAGYDLADMEMCGQTIPSERMAFGLKADGGMPKVETFRDWQDVHVFTAGLSVVQARLANGLLKLNGTGGSP